jgi:hypothetical protein
MKRRQFFTLVGATVCMAIGRATHNNPRSLSGSAFSLFGSTIMTSRSSSRFDKV